MMNFWSSDLVSLCRSLVHCLVDLLVVGFSNWSF